MDAHTALRGSPLFAKLDDERGSFNFRRVVMLNPPVRLYNSISLLDRMLENLPGRYPFTGGVFPFKRKGEDPTRMFAGEGGPERTNKRFHYLSEGMPAARLGDLHTCPMPTPSAHMGGPIVSASETGKLSEG
mgnify:CR=1 FL=1